MTPKVANPQTVLIRADTLRREMGDDFRDRIVSSLYADAQRIALTPTWAEQEGRWVFSMRIDPDKNRVDQIKPVTLTRKMMVSANNALLRLAARSF